MTLSPIRPIALSSARIAALWLPVVVWAAFIFHLSSIPHLRFLQSHWDFLVRKIGHLGVYGILARLVARALTGSTLWQKLEKGFSIQSLVPGDSCAAWPRRVPSKLRPRPFGDRA